MKIQRVAIALTIINQFGFRGLMNSLPNRSLIAFEGEEHNAMDTIPEQFAAAITNFLKEQP